MKAAFVQLATFVFRLLNAEILFFKAVMKATVFGSRVSPASSAPSTSPEVSSSTVALLLIVAVLILNLTESRLSSKTLALIATLSSCSTSSASRATLHGRKHSLRIHLTWIDARSHHCLHHSLHLGWDTFHPRHLSSWCCSWHHSWHRSHGHHHVHVLKHLLVVLRNLLLAIFRPQRILFTRVQSPCEFIESVIKVIADISTRPSPWLVILR